MNVIFGLVVTVTKKNINCKTHLLSFDQDVSSIICRLMVKCRRVFGISVRARFPLCVRITKRKIEKQKIPLTPKKKQE